MQYTDCHSFLNANATRVVNRLTVVFTPTSKQVRAGHNNIQTNVLQNLTNWSKDLPLMQNLNTLCLNAGKTSKLSGEHMATEFMDQTNRASACKT